MKLLVGAVVFLAVIGAGYLLHEIFGIDSMWALIGAVGLVLLWAAYVGWTNG
jgi:ABC-type iron transport system FetAB permease component